MKAGNASIMAAAAVVVALCLLFSWVYLDDGDGNAEFRTEQVGDYVVWENHLVRADGTTEDDISVQTLVAVVGDTRLQCVEYEDGTSDYYWDTVGFEGSMEHIGTETVAIDGLGEYECDVLRGEYEGIPETIWITADGTCLKTVFEQDGVSYTSVMVSTSLTGDVPEYGVCGVDDMVEVGDYSVFTTYLVETGMMLSMAEGSFTFEVTSVEDGVVTYDHVDLDGVVDEHTTSVSDFATFDDDSYTLMGQAIVDTIYGERLCDVYDLDGGTEIMMFVGSGDGVIYMMSDDDGSDLRCSYLVFSTEVYGDVPYDTTLPGDGSAEEVGDSLTVLVQRTEADGSRWSGVYTMTKVSEIDGVGHCQTTWFGYDPLDPVETDLFVLNDAEKTVVGTEVVNTVYGAIECDIVEYVADDGAAVAVARYGGYPVYSVEKHADGAETRYTYIYNTVVNGFSYDSCVQRDPEAGDQVVLMVTYPDHSSEAIDQTVVSVDGSTITVDQEGRILEYGLEEYIRGYDGEAVCIGTALVDSMYGTRLCEVWDSDEGLHYIGVDDGVNYLTELDDGTVAYLFYADFVDRA